MWHLHLVGTGHLHGNDSRHAVGVVPPPEEATVADLVVDMDLLVRSAIDEERLRTAVVVEVSARWRGHVFYEHLSLALTLHLDETAAIAILADAVVGEHEVLARSGQSNLLDGGPRVAESARARDVVALGAMIIQALNRASPWLPLEVWCEFAFGVLQGKQVPGPLCPQPKRYWPCGQLSAQLLHELL